MKPKNSVFAANLKKIDFMFSKLVANMLLDFFGGKANTVPNLTKLLSEGEILREYGFSE